MRSSGGTIGVVMVEVLLPGFGSTTTPPGTLTIAVLTTDPTAVGEITAVTV